MHRYTIADIAIYAWYGAMVGERLYDAAEFLDVASYTNVVAWAERISARPAVQRGLRVNRNRSNESEQVLERHGASDLE